MNNVSSCHLAVAATVLEGIAPLVAADPPDILRDYRFINSHSTVHVSGGLPDDDLGVAVAGRFGIVTGYGYGIDPPSHSPIS